MIFLILAAKIPAFKCVETLTAWELQRAFHLRGLRAINDLLILVYTAEKFRSVFWWFVVGFLPFTNEKIQEK